MNLARALRLTPSAHWAPSPNATNVAFGEGRVGVISLVGAGGKTTAIFQLAHEIVNAKSPTVILTATSHLGTWQTSLADHHIVANDLNDLNNIPSHGITLITGEIENERTKPVNQTILNWLREYSRRT